MLPSLLPLLMLSQGDVVVDRPWAFVIENEIVASIDNVIASAAWCVLAFSEKCLGVHSGSILGVYKSV